MRVLIAEDDPISRLWLEKVLESLNYEIVVVANGDEALHELRKTDAPQLVLLDWLMPGMDGIEVCRTLKADPIGRFSYVIMLTSRSATDDVVEALDNGADDFIRKPFEPAELRVRLRVGERMIGLQQELLLKASHDELTGTLSRRTLMEYAVREFDMARRNGSPLSALLLDIDHFKNINDTYGHQVGDAVLRELAARMRESLRTVDIIGRYGGEEFLILLPQCDSRVAAEVAERLREDVARPLVLDNVSLQITASIGVATESALTLDLQYLIHQADTALYSAKAHGRDRIEVAD